MAMHGFSNLQFPPNTSTRYSGVPSYDSGHYHDNEPLHSPPHYSQDPKPCPNEDIDLQSHTPMQGHRSIWKTFIFQFFSFLWTVPVGTLLYLNIKGHVLGASAWCPTGKCYPQIFASQTITPQLLAARYDRDNHNLLGALQLVAKALELWFILICSWLVYLITMFLASRKGGLPIAYITRPVEFVDIEGVLDPLLWTTLPSLTKKSVVKQARKRVWLFVLFTVLLGLICNLMGPATAVLVLPALQWIETPKVESYVFRSLNADNPPAPGGIMSLDQLCTSDQIIAGQYSCNAYYFGRSMDSWVESYVASQRAFNGITQQDMISFQFNTTKSVDQNGDVSDVVSWAPSRQLVQDMTNDWIAIQNISLGQSKEDFAYPDFYDSYVPLNNTVNSIVQRNGPILGVAANMWVGYDNTTWWDTQLDGTEWGVDGTKFVRCFNNYNAFDTPIQRGVINGTYTKCVKWGFGWNDAFKVEDFWIEGLYRTDLKAMGPPAYVLVFTSDTAAFLPNGSPPDGFSPSCLPVNSITSQGLTCDWDAFFTPDPTSPMYSRSFLTNQIQIISNTEPEDGHPSTVTLLFDFVAYLNFTMYAFDPSPVTNPLYLATNPDLPINGKATYVDPAWTVAAWSADLGGIIGSNRSSTLELLKVIDVLWQSDVYQSPDPLQSPRAYPNVDYVSLLPIIQTLSLIEWSLDEQSSPNALPVDQDHPLLQRNAHINVWAYGLSGRTSWLGVAVAGTGILIVLFQTLLGIIDRRPYRGPTELLIAALEHAPSKEFLGMEHDEKRIARTPFMVEDYHHASKAAKFKFGKIG